MKPRIIAHRGASGHATENSLAAFREAIRLGADGIELDVQVARTGELIVHHDPVLPGRGTLGDLDLATIRSSPLPNGEPIPTLEEALEAIRPAPPNRRLEVWIELKVLPSPADRRLLDTIDRAPCAGSCAVHSFDHRIIARLGSLRPSLRRGILSASYPIDPVTPMNAAGGSALWQEWRLIDAALVDRVHEAGGEVIAWTVNHREVAEQLARLGVDALCGNWPERLKLG